MNKSWRQLAIKQQLYGNILPIRKTIQVRWMQNTAEEVRRKSKAIYSCGPLSHARAKVWRPAKTYIQQLCSETGCCPEDLPGALDDGDGWRERSGKSVLSAQHDNDNYDDPRRIYEWYGLKFFEGIWVWHETLEDGIVLNVMNIQMKMLTIVF